MGNSNPLVHCDVCDELVPASSCKDVFGWTVCEDCRREADGMAQQATGYDVMIDLPPFWQDFGEYRGKN